MKVKKLISIVLIAAMQAVCILTAFAEPLDSTNIYAAPDSTIPADEVKAIIDVPPANLISGDVDRNGKTDVIDALLALRISMDGMQDDDLALVCADVDSDMEVTAADGLMIFRNVVADMQLPANRRISFINSLFAQMGKPYVRGGSGPDSFDCSGLVYYCLNQANYSIGRWTAAAYAANEDWTRIASISDLEVGDLMFFRQADESSISHVAIYIGNNMIIHASNSNGRVLIATLTNWYYTNFRWARRVDL